MFFAKRDSLEDDVLTGRRQTVQNECNIEEVTMLVRANLIEAVGISHGTYYKILTDDLNMSYVTQHSVPHILMQDQCDDHVTIYGDLISSADNDLIFRNRIITEDKTWSFMYNLQLKGANG